MSSIGQLLISAQQGSKEAWENIESQQKANPGQFLCDISSELASGESPKVSRQVAGLMLKNTLVNATQQEGQSNLWEAIQESQKQHVRNSALGTLACEDKDIRASASQAVATIAKQDLPKGQWTDILTILVNNSTHVNPIYKTASLMTLGYICEDLPKDCLQKSMSDSILTAIAENVRPEETNNEVKLIALKALRNSLPFAESNFKQDNEREIIMNLIFHGCNHSDDNIRTEGFQILCDIAFHYYEFLSFSLNQIGNLTFQAIRTDLQSIAVLGIEFWNIVADTEKLKLENGESAQGYTATAANSLVPLLLEKVPVFEQEDEEWNLHKACGSCIGAITSVVGDPLVDLLVSFISKFIGSQDWKLRTSAALVFGMMLEGPTKQKLKSNIETGINSLLSLLEDQVETVRQTAAWSISKICEFHCEVVAQQFIFNQLVPKLVRSLKDKPKIACHCCWALINLIDNTTHQKLFTKDHVELLLEELLTAAYRVDAPDTEHNLQLASYSAITTLLEKAPDECIPLIENKIPQFVNLLKETTQTPSSEPLQSFICSALQSAIVRASLAAISDETANEFMQTLFRIFNMRNTVIEEGIQAVGALAGNIENRFLGYIQSFGPYLMWSLNKQDSVSICKAGTMCVGDIARALGEQAYPYLREFIQPILKNLESELVSTEVKVQSIESLADLAGHTKGSFLEYLNQVMTIIGSAANASLQTVSEEENPDLFDYLAELREAILEFYVGLLQGLIESRQQQLIFQTVPNIVEYTIIAVQDQFKPSENMHMSGIGLFGDIASAYGSQVSSVLKTPRVVTYISNYTNHPEVEIRRIAQYSQAQINKI